jgi:hypothetical protein
MRVVVASPAGAEHRDLVRQFMGQLGALAPTPSAQPTTSLVPSPLLPGQMVMPAVVWDWPDPVTGTATDAQFRFADTVPQTTADGALYLPSSRSFSQGYRAFLECIDATQFPSPAMLSRAIQRAALPTGSPASEPTPPGWTKVTVAGYAQWSPIWDLPNCAAAWVAAVASGSINNPGSILIALADAGTAAMATLPLLRARDSSGAALVLPTASFTSVRITASCWGQIPIYPGSWFDPAMVALGRQCVPNAAAFFGPAGLMACRVASFYVAWKPIFEFSANQPVSNALQQTLASASAVQALGVSVQASAAAGGGGDALRWVGTDVSPVIVAVVIEALA